MKSTLARVRTLLEQSKLAPWLLVPATFLAVAWQFAAPDSITASLVYAALVLVAYTSLRRRFADPKQAVGLCTAAVVLAGAWLVTDTHNTYASLTLVSSLVIVYLSAANRWIKIGLALIALCGVIPYAGSDNLSLMVLFVAVFLNITLALGLNLVVGFAGLLDLGYIAFFAGGAYLYAFFASGQAALAFPAHASSFPFGGWWFWVALPLTTMFAALLGLALGLPVLRLRGDYLAIVTLGFGEIIYVLARNLDKPINLTNGSMGISNITPPSLFGWRLSKDIHFYFIGLIIAVLTTVIMTRIERSRVGRAWAAIREDEIAARAMGVPLTRMKLLAFATGAAFAGASGMLFAVKQQFIDPETFTFVESVGIVSMVILGGLGSIPGAIIGAVTVSILRLQVLQRLTDWLHNLHMPDAIDLVKYRPLIYGLIMILMMLYRQEGLLPIKRKPEDIAAIEAAPDPLAESPSPPSKQAQA